VFQIRWVVEHNPSILDIPIFSRAAPECILILVSSAWLIVNTPVFYSIIPQLGMMCIITGIACLGRFQRGAGQRR
jgi:hypothetical protein